MEVDEEFLCKLPKLELHAHLNGSLYSSAILEMGENLYGSNSSEFLALTKSLTNFDGVDLNGCFEKFKIVHNLTATAKGLTIAVLKVIRDFAKDNVIYLELRTTPKATEHMSKRQYLECVLKTIVEAKETYPEITVKLLPSFDRGKEVSAAEETLNIVLDLRKVYGGIITGIDFSGNPYIGFFNDFIPILERARENGLGLALHCAETPDKVEIADMLEFGMDRCGHGTFLNDTEFKLLAKRNIALECCLTSNIKCKTVQRITDHHFRRLFSANNPVVICTDDCGIFDTSPTKELLLAAKTFKLNHSHIYRLMLIAVQHSFSDGVEKDELRRRIQKFFKDQGVTTD